MPKTSEVEMARIDAHSMVKHDQNRANDNRHIQRSDNDAFAKCILKHRGSNGTADDFRRLIGGGLDFVQRKLLVMFRKATFRKVTGIIIWMTYGSGKSYSFQADLVEFFTIFLVDGLA